MLQGGARCLPRVLMVAALATGLVGCQGGAAPSGAPPAAASGQAPALTGARAVPTAALSAPPPSTWERGGYAVRWLRPLPLRVGRDGVEVVPADGAAPLRVVITSGGGTGAVQLQPVQGAWPRVVTVELQYARDRPFTALEGVQVETLDAGQASGSELLRPWPDHAVVREHGGRLRLLLPEGGLRERQALRLSWVDRYRN